MTDDFMEMVKTDLEVWKERKDREIEEYNNGVPKRRAELRKEIRINKRIHELLNEENVEEFSRLIGYKEDENKLKLLYNILIPILIIILNSYIKLKSISI